MVSYLVHNNTADLRQNISAEVKEVSKLCPGRLHSLFSILVPSVFPSDSLSDQ